ncbi:MAG: hypothetical protein ACJ8F3_02530 [Xanthobacteraceae bacterium]
MADYYPLISRAVVGLEKNSGDSRRAVYERARQALLAQLRGVTPALDESDITRERLALEESIRKVEAEAARRFVEPSRQPPAPKIRPIEPRGREEAPAPRARSSEAPPALQKEVDTPPPRRYVNPPGAATQEARAELSHRPRPAPPPALPEPRQSEPVVAQPRAEPAAAPRHPLRRQQPAAERHALSDAGLKDFRSVVSDPRDPGDTTARADKAAREAYPVVAPPTTLDRPPPRALDRSSERGEARAPHRPQERTFELPDHSRPHEDFSEPMLEPAFGVDDARPTPSKSRRMPPPRDDHADNETSYDDEAGEAHSTRSYRPLIKGVAVTGAIGAMCAALIALMVWQWPNLVGRYQALRSPAVDTVREAAAPAVSKKVQERVVADTEQTPASVSAPGTESAAVAQKVVLYEEDPSIPEGKRFVGSAIWRTETISPGPGQPPELAIRADVEVPERKLAMTWSLRRNTDKGLPASHTVEIIFKIPPEFPAGGISNVPGIMMKPAETTKGAILRGLAVKVTSGYFLIGLSSSDADKDYNIQMLKERSWFDIPVVYNNNRRAILAVEKGTPGERIFAEAFKTWKQ